MTKRGRAWLWIVVLAVWAGGLLGCSGLPRIVILHDPLTPQEHVTLGESYQARGLGDLATREFEAALHREAEFVPALIGLGNLAYATNAFEESAEFYRRALAAVPGHPGASNNLALVYLASGARLDEAERLARSAVELEGTVRPYALDTLARIYTQQGRYREAARALEEAAALIPADNRGFHEQLSRSQHELSAASSRPTN
ncbi:MAG: tetratricopeptide repeat protein [Nitrospirae bacterium]|nr:MAG: tetratricopeptide repeat protein [Nitrospirota bacterium]